MKLLKRMIVLCLSLILLLVSASGAVSGEGVIFKLSKTTDYMDYDWDSEIKYLNYWLMQYPDPSGVIDLFVPGYSMRQLENDPESDTIDFDIIPTDWREPRPSETVIVADIPDKYAGVYNELISEIRDEGNIEIFNMARKGNTLFFSCNAALAEPTAWGTPDENVLLYAVVLSKQTKQIVRYDYIDQLVGCYVGSGCSSIPYELDRERIVIELPDDYDPEKYEYGFCILVYDHNDTWEFCYMGETRLCSLVEVDIPTIDSLFGDVNEDGKLSLLDVSHMLKCIAKWDNVNCNANLSDIDMNGTTDLNDVVIALKLIAGWENV